MQRSTSEIVLLIVASTVCAVVLATVVAIACLAPQSGINMEIVGYVYDVVKVMLGAVIGGLGVAIANKQGGQT